MIMIVDFGSQTTHLISRRLRELGVETAIVIPEDAVNEFQKSHPKGIILSGGPASVYEKDAPPMDKSIMEQNIPVLGICYGHQLVAYILGGEVVTGKKKEFGPAEVQIINDSPLFKSLPPSFRVWMNHGDEVLNMPAGFRAIALSGTIPHAAIAHEEKKIYGVQFHPEVIHTQFGEEILGNFAEICGITTQKKAIDTEFVDSLINDIKESIQDKKAICALSGGVDSSVAAVLVHKAIKDNLTAVYIDSGLMRKGETDKLQEVFKSHYHMSVKVVNAEKEFLKALEGITDPEAKRKSIGKTFIEVLEKEAIVIGADFLVQGTIYPDVIESSGSKHSVNIKSHHNVGGLPEDMNLVLIEPLRQFYKDEVRAIGKIVELPDAIVHRQPFPGPGLAVRIIGEVTKQKLEILRKADAIIQEEIEKTEYAKTLWQIFAIFAGIQTTGVRGDNRAYGETIAIRAIEAKDAMSAHFARLPYDVLDLMATRIVNEVPEVNRVLYDISNKPPATMEWE